MTETSVPSRAGLLANLAVSFFALALIAAAVPQLKDGIASDGAIPVPSYILLEGHTLPQAQYRHALDSIAGADAANGEAAISAAEMAILAGARPASQAGRLKAGLAAAPASARGWLLLSDAMTDALAHRQDAVAALSQSFLLSHYDFWIAGRRAAAAARLWHDLDRDTHAMALKQAVELWEEPQLRPQLLHLLSARGGPELVRNAFAFLPDEQTDLNRWMAARRRGPATP